MSTNRYLNAGAPGTGTTVDNMASRVKAWANASNIPATPTLNASLNVSSLTDAAIGSLAYNISLPFSAGNWAPAVASGDTSWGTKAIVSSLTSSSVTISTYKGDTATGSAADATTFINGTGALV